MVENAYSKHISVIKLVVKTKSIANESATNTIPYGASQSPNSKLKIPWVWICCNKYTLKAPVKIYNFDGGFECIFIATNPNPRNFKFRVWGLGGPVRDCVCRGLICYALSFNNKLYNAYMFTVRIFYHWRSI